MSENLKISVSRIQWYQDSAVGSNINIRDLSAPLMSRGAALFHHWQQLWSTMSYAENSLFSLTEMILRFNIKNYIIRSFWMGYTNKCIKNKMLMSWEARRFQDKTKCNMQEVISLEKTHFVNFAFSLVNAWNDRNLNFIGFYRFLA